MGEQVKTATLNEIGMLTQSRITAGVDLPLSQLDDWQQKAQGWTIELCSTLTTEQQLEVGGTKTSSGIWPTFHYWKGSAHKGEPPTVADLIHSVASDCSYLESEPEQVDYPTGKAIEHNERKMRRLFGYQLWERIKAYDEDEIQAAFGRFS